MKKVRDAGPDDASRLACMLDEFNIEFGDPTPGTAVLEGRVRRLIEAGTKHYLIAEHEHEATGFVQFHFHASIWSDGPILFLDELYVAPERRGQGFGRAMMEKLVEHAKGRGAAGMEVATGEDDTAARGLYESLGFRNEIEGEQNTRSLFYELEFS